MRATFEEKTYENYFNRELAELSDVYFPLGQVQEGSLGFDASAMTSNRRLWEMLGYPFRLTPYFDGVFLQEIAGEMERFLEVNLINIPNMKANLLFQYKRPQYITKSTGKEWNHWNEAYYRYDIYKEQHDLLMHIDNHFDKQVFIVYAAPALIDVDSLVDAFINRQIISLSNFKKASNLSGHHRNTYIEGGLNSVACSKPTPLEDFDLIKELSKLEVSEKISDKYNIGFVKNFSNNILTIMSENRQYAESYAKLKGQYSKLEQYELFYSHILLKIFSEITGLQWLVKL